MIDKAVPLSLVDRSQVIRFPSCESKHSKRVFPAGLAPSPRMLSPGGRARYLSASWWTGSELAPLPGFG